MDDSCCICGLVLATNDSDFPQWCKSIRALCRIERKTILTDIGSVDGDAMPFKFSILQYGSRRFYYCRNSAEDDDSEDFCYPFHDICWTLLHDIGGDKLLGDNLDPLFDIFNSSHYVQKPRCLSWGQDYYLEDILDTPLRKDEVISTLKKADFTKSVDPLHFTFPLRQQASSPARPITTLMVATVFNVKKIFLGFSVFVTSFIHSYRTRLLRAFPAAVVPDSHPRVAGLLSLPTEILESIIISLDYADVQHFLKASSNLYRIYGGDGCNLPSLFWKSRFWVHGETAFARSIPPPPYSYEDWFFTITSEMKNGLNNLKLRNRKRIWKIGLDLISVIRAIKDPDRVLHGDIVTPPASLMRDPTASCLAMKYDSGNCRELKQVFVPFDNWSSGTWLSNVIPSYVLVSNRRLISGLTFTFSNGAFIDIGQFGFEAIDTDGLAERYLHCSASSRPDQLAVSKWPLRDPKGICVGLDAMRIVRISIENREHNKLNNVLWVPLYPSFVPSLHEKDIAALYQLQRQFFAPASFISIEPENGRLIAITVYSPIGRGAGVTGIRFIYDTGLESMWGSADDAASLAFFLDRSERLIGVSIYKVGTVVCHLKVSHLVTSAARYADKVLQFTTNFHRTSDLVPQFQDHSKLLVECVSYTAPKGGYLSGFCGCFTNSPSSSSKQLNCFGVVGAATEIPLNPMCLSIENCTQHGEGRSRREMPLGGLWDHGEQRSCLFFAKQFSSIQASVNMTESKYRRVGQVTGLLFHSSDEGYPDLLGQWTGAGETYYFEVGERILDLSVATIKPKEKILIRAQLSQVEGITVVTNRKKITWSRTAPRFKVEFIITNQWRQKISEVSWDFNAIFDRVKCNYSCI
ncbi:hypothetical protein G7Y89_g928 [Cudoniella acicularis]|uniref:F-box domain-containing protein n=1 Tax=Cudoniella acicularis TaxID=354080 RepID=A0A8H4W7G4_9HELO|nr:hypothetical protein G7Y89_g928 [Cudoniella acicularis]